MITTLSFCDRQIISRRSWFYCLVTSVLVLYLLFLCTRQLSPFDRLILLLLLFTIIIIIVIIAITVRTSAPNTRHRGNQSFGFIPELWKAVSRSKCQNITRRFWVRTEREHRRIDRYQLVFWIVEFFFNVFSPSFTTCYSSWLAAPLVHAYTASVETSFMFLLK